MISLFILLITIIESEKRLSSYASLDGTNQQITQITQKNTQVNSLQSILYLI